MSVAGKTRQSASLLDVCVDAGDGPPALSYRPGESFREFRPHPGARDRYWVFARPENASLIVELRALHRRGSEVMLVSPFHLGVARPTNAHYRLEMLQNVSKRQTPTADGPVASYWPAREGDYISFMVSNLYRSASVVAPADLALAVESHPAYPALSFVAQDRGQTPRGVELMAGVIDDLQDPGLRLVGAAGSLAAGLAQRFGLTVTKYNQLLTAPDDLTFWYSRLGGKLFELWAGRPPLLVGNKFLPHNFLWPAVMDRRQDSLGYVRASKKLLRLVLLVWSANLQPSPEEFFARAGFFEDSLEREGFRAHWARCGQKCRYV